MRSRNWVFSMEAASWLCFEKFQFLFFNLHLFYITKSVERTPALFLIPTICWFWSHKTSIRENCRREIILSDAHFLDCFIDAKATTKWKKLTTWSWVVASRPVGIWLMSMLTPTAVPCYLTITNQKIMHKLITYPGTLLPHLAFKNVLQKPTEKCGLSVH